MAHFNFRRACASFIATAIMLTTVQLSPVAGTELPPTDTSGQIKQDIISTTDVAEEITQEIVSTNDALSDDHGTVLYSGTCGDSVNWSLYDSGTLVISGTGAMTDYSSYGNQAPWYSYKNSITSAIIENGVTSIGDNAFYYCKSLTSVTIPDSVTTIGESAFGNCTSLASVTVPDSVTSIGDNAFYYCKSLTSVTIPDSVTTIGYHAFSDCTSLASVTIPDSVTTIGEYAFDGCTNLASVTIGNGVESIGSYAFRYCTSLATVYYGGSEAMWSDVEISSGNEVLLNAAVNTVPVQYLTVTLPSVVEYEYGQELCLDGLTVTEYLENGIVYQSNSYTVSAFDSLSYGKQTLTVTSSGATAIFAVTVKASEADGVIEPVTLGMTVLELKASYDGYTVYVLDSDKSTVLGDNDVIKTGCIIQLVQDGQVVDSQAVAVKCDVDGDGKLSAKDFIRLKKQILLGGCVDYPEYADANGDGTINEKDLEYLAQMIA